MLVVRVVGRPRFVAVCELGIVRKTRGSFAVDLLQWIFCSGSFTVDLLQKSKNHAVLGGAGHHDQLDNIFGRLWTIKKRLVRKITEQSE